MLEEVGVLKILVIGSGGREHALAYFLSRSSVVDRLYWTPGNAATEQIAENPGIPVDDFEGLLKFAKKEDINLTVVGPELPLVKGLTDYFEENGLLVFGPKAEAAMIEGSKIFAKKLMEEASIPTAKYESFLNFEEASRYLDKIDPPIVVKADGLAAGKGVTICYSREEAKQTLHNYFIEKIFGESGTRVVIEEYLSGEEATVLALCDGEVILPMISSQDHKPVFDNDKGPNTGGMGAIAPAPVVTDSVMMKVMNRIMYPLLNKLKTKGITYRGIIYAGLMIADGEPYVVEFNCRFGDPETEVVLPLLKSDLAELLLSTSLGELSGADLAWEDGYACDVVIASGGYPGKYEKGKVIEGIEKVERNPDSYVFHAGTKKVDNKVVTSGGRVLNIVGKGKTLKEAIDKAYKNVSLVQFENMHYRKDIGFRGLKHLNN